MKDIKIFLKKLKRKKQQYGCERYKILSEDKKQSFLSKEKNIIEWDKMPYYNYKKQLFKIKKSYFDEEYMVFWSYKFTLGKKYKIINYKHKKLKPYIKMDKKIIKLDETEIEEHKFHQYKSSIFMNNIDINKIAISHKFSLGK